MLYYARKFPEAEAQLRRTLEIDPTYTLANAELAHVLSVRGRVDEAIQSMDKAPDFKMRYEGASVGFALARAGRVAEARQELDERLRRRAVEQRVGDACECRHHDDAARRLCRRDRHGV